MSERTRSLVQFLTYELLIAADSIEFGLQQSEQVDSLLAIVLWQYGFINLIELEKIFDWLAASTCVIKNEHLSVELTL
jgi:Protein of unknown function (DUF2949)